MSCSFWIRRKKLAALKRKQAETAVTVEKKETVEKAVDKKPAKKAVQKNDDTKSD